MFNKFTSLFPSELDVKIHPVPSAWQMPIAIEDIAPPARARPISTTAKFLFLFIGLFFLLGLFVLLALLSNTSNDLSDVSSTVNDQSNAIAVLQTEAYNQSHNIDQLWCSLTETQTDVALQNISILQAENAITWIEEDLSIQNRSISSLKNSVASIEISLGSIQLLNNSLSVIDSLISALKTRLGIQNYSIEQIDSSIASVQSLLASLELLQNSTIVLLRQDVIRLNDSISEIESWLGSLQSQLNTVNTNLSYQINEVVIDLRSNVSWLQGDINTLSSQLISNASLWQSSLGMVNDTISSQINTLSNHVASLASSLTSLIDAVNVSLSSQLNVLNTTLSSRIDTVNDTLTSKVDEVDMNLASTSSSLQSQLDAVNASQTSSVDRLQSSITSLGIQVDAHNNSINEIEAGIATIEGQVREVQGSVITIMAVIIQNSTEIVALENALVSNNASLNNVERSVITLQTRITDQNDTINAIEVSVIMLQRLVEQVDNSSLVVLMNGLASQNLSIIVIQASLETVQSQLDILVGYVASNDSSLLARIITVNNTLTSLINTLLSPASGLVTITGNLDVTGTITANSGLSFTSIANTGVSMDAQYGDLHFQSGAGSTSLWEITTHSGTALFTVSEGGAVNSALNTLDDGAGNMVIHGTPPVATFGGANNFVAALTVVQESTVDDDPVYNYAAIFQNNQAGTLNTDSVGILIMNMASSSNPSYPPSAINLDMSNYYTEQIVYPTIRIQASDDGDWSSNLIFYAKTPGDVGNSLVATATITSTGNLIMREGTGLIQTGIKGMAIFGLAGLTTTITGSASQTEDLTITLPTTAGEAGQFWQTNGAGVTTWAYAAAGMNASNSSTINIINPSGGNLNVIGNITSGGNLTITSNNNAGSNAQIVIQGQTTMSMQLLIGYNTVSNYGYIQSVNQGIGYTPLELNSGGGQVTIGSGGLSVTGPIMATSSTPVKILAPSSTSGVSNGLFLYQTGGVNGGAAGPGVSIEFGTFAGSGGQATLAVTQNASNGADFVFSNYVQSPAGFPERFRISAAGGITTNGGQNTLDDGSGNMVIYNKLTLGTAGLVGTSTSGMMIDRTALNFHFQSGAGSSNYWAMYNYGGAALFYVYPTGKVATALTTLDDGSGNMVINNKLTLGSAGLVATSTEGIMMDAANGNFHFQSGASGSNNWNIESYSGTGLFEVYPGGKVGTTYNTLDDGAGNMQIHGTPPATNDGNFAAALVVVQESTTLTNYAAIFQNNQAATASTNANGILLMNVAGPSASQINLDMSHYYSSATTIPTVRMQASDDGSSSAHLIFYAKTPGATNNALYETARITSTGNFLLPATGTGGITTGTGGITCNGDFIQPGETMVGITAGGGGLTTAGPLTFAPYSITYTTTLESSTSQTSNLIFILPPTDGTSGQYLTATGGGATAWTTLTSVGNTLFQTIFASGSGSFTIPTGALNPTATFCGGGGYTVYTGYAGAGGGGVILGLPLSAGNVYTYSVGTGGSSSSANGGSTTLTFSGFTVTANGGTGSTTATTTGTAGGTASSSYGGTAFTGGAGGPGGSSSTSTTASTGGSAGFVGKGGVGIYSGGSYYGGGGGSLGNGGVCCGSSAIAPGYGGGTYGGDSNYVEINGVFYFGGSGVMIFSYYA